MLLINEAQSSPPGNTEHEGAFVDREEVSENKTEDPAGNCRSLRKNGGHSEGVGTGAKRKCSIIEQRL